GVVEAELAEDYLEGTLPARDARRFEQHFLVDGDRQRRLAFVRLLKTYAASGAVAARSPQAGIVSRFLEMCPVYPVRTAGVTLAGLTLLAGNLWFLAAPYRLRGELEQLRAQQARTAEQSKRLQDQVARLESARPAPAPIAPLALSPGLLRSEGTLARL